VLSGYENFHLKEEMLKMERSAKIMIVLTGVVIALFIGLQIWTRHKTDQIKVKPLISAQKQVVKRIKAERNVHEQVPASSGTETVAKRKHDSVKTSTSGFVYHQYDQQNQNLNLQEDSKEITATKGDEVGIDWRKYIDEDGNVTDWEKYSLARMHSHGWYKPEDVPIIYEKPDFNSPQDGVYIWIEEVGGDNNVEPPEYIKGRNRELEEELDRATRRRNGKEVIRIARELAELNEPYRKKVRRLHMFAVSIPKSWEPYFDAIFEIECEASFQSLVDGD